MGWLEPWIAAWFVALAMGWYPCCCGEECDCDNCSDPSQSPPYLDLTIAGVGSGSCPGSPSPCAAWNNTFTVDWCDCIGTHGVHSGITSSCYLGWIVAELYLDVDDHYKLRVQTWYYIGLGFGAQSSEWIKDFGTSKPACDEWNGLNVPLSWWSSLCDGTNVSMSVSAAA